MFSVFLDEPSAVEVLQHDEPYALGPILHARELADHIEDRHPETWRDFVFPRAPVLAR